MRQIVLDTETTGLKPEEGHRIIEIGALEMIDRSLTGRQFHKYLNPERQVDADAVEVHGLSDEFLEDKPKFSEVAEEFIEFIRGAELVIHNAAFDVGFLDAELSRLEQPVRIEEVAQVLDTLELARDLHPGQRNNLDTLCRRYDVDNSNRTLHGALLDSELLADVYLLMTGGQVDLGLDLAPVSSPSSEVGTADYDASLLRVRAATEEERAAHEQRLAAIEHAAGETGCLWRTLPH